MSGSKGGAQSRKLSRIHRMEGKAALASSAEIGQLIHRTRIELGLSEAEVVSYLGEMSGTPSGKMSASLLKEYESGQKPIPLSHIHALSNCLSISPRTIIQLINRKNKVR